MESSNIKIEHDIDNDVYGLFFNGKLIASMDISDLQDIVSEVEKIESKF